jgi:hypothetical protein
MTSFHYARQTSAPRYVSAARLYSILRTKLGCADGGWRDQESWYWVTSNGISFPVADPAAHPNCRPVHGGSRQELCYPYEYARDLVQHVRDLTTTTPVRKSSLPRLAIA